jgi:hypothetical protein
MKKIYLLTVLILTASLLQAQSILRYEFLNTLAEKNNSGPELTVLGDPGIYVLDTLNEINNATKTVYRFEANSGFQFNNAAAGNFIGESYTIEIYYVFDNLNSWRRVVDWKNRKTDYGAYVYYGQLNFYPYVYSGEAPVLPGEYSYYVITRDGATNEVLIYTDARVEIDFIDNNGDALVDADNVINFFHDDLVVPNEASSGAVALLNMYNYVLDSNTIVQNYANLGGTVFGLAENRKNSFNLQVYPNPASQYVNVNLGEFRQGEKVQISVTNAAGSTVFSEEVLIGNNSTKQLDTTTWPEGIFLIRTESANKTASSKIAVFR